MQPHNFLPGQYAQDAGCRINHNYLLQQFQDSKAIFIDIEALVRSGDYTLGKAVDAFEAQFQQIEHCRYAIGVGSGTDAIFLSLKALGIGPGDEVITTPFTFYATIGAIVTAGGRPVFVDIGPDLNIDASKIEQAITPRTKAIVPVHWSGLICEMESIRAIADRHGLFIVEDACHAIQAQSRGAFAGAFADTAAFSMHPLKNLNVWGDGGVIITNSEKIHDRLVLLRNHGLRDRDTCDVFAYNSRLDSLQAIVALHLMKKLDDITAHRIANAAFFDSQLGRIPGIMIPYRDPNKKHVYHIYSILVEKRDELKSFLIQAGIDAKIHYPIPMHLQPAAREYGYHAGDFPAAESACRKTLSLPVHEFLTETERHEIVEKVREFYR